MNINDIITESHHACPHCGGPLVEYSDLMEKKDACYYKVKAGAKVWPSAYASGRLVQCRKKGAANWGNKSEGVAEGSLNELSSGLLQRAAQLAKNKRNQAMEPELHNALGGGYMNPLAKHYDNVSQKINNRAAQVGKKETIQKIASPAVMRKIGMSGVAEGEYDSRKPFGVRYKVFAGREGRMTTREYWTSSEEKLQRAVDKIQALNNFYEIDGYSYPKESQGVAENKAAGINKMFNNLGDPVYANLQRVALLAMQGRQQESAGRLQSVIKDASPAVQKKITDAVNNIKPVMINGKVADSSTLDKSKAHQDWTLNTFIPWVQSLLGHQDVTEAKTVEFEGVAEGFSNDMSTEDMIVYLRQHHDKNLHQDYLNHLTSTNSKFVLKNIPINSIRTELSGLDRAKVEQYKKMDFNKAPPIVVGSDGNILDGYHRATVAKALGIPAIKAYVGIKSQPGVDEATGDKRFDAMMGQIQREPTIPDSQMPPTDVKDLYQWAVKNNKPYHKIFAEWANREGYKSVAPALQKAGDLDSDALDYWTPDVWKIWYGPDSEMPQGWSKERVPDELRDYLETVFDAYDRIVFDWPTEYRQIGEQGMAEAQLDEKCWDGYQQQGMKNKSGRQVPNCVPVEENTDPEIEEMYEAMNQLAEEIAAKQGVSVDLAWESFEALPDHMLYETAAWRRKEGKSKKGGLNAKGVASYRRENPGSKLQMAVTTKPSKLKPGSKAAKRRKSFCARMGGVKGPMKKPNGKPTRKALALRKWNC